MMKQEKEDNELVTRLIFLVQLGRVDKKEVHMYIYI